MSSISTLPLYFIYSMHVQHLQLTANHSSLSSPSGSLTAFLRLPLPKVASANCFSCQFVVPFPAFCGRNGALVRELLYARSFSDMPPLCKKRRCLLCCGEWCGLLSAAWNALCAGLAYAGVGDCGSAAPSSNSWLKLCCEAPRESRR